ncbi:DNA polymerase Y family protein [Methylosinus sp. C49]|uniref:Y-family DNA polymerase n=1 Tax=Methylosinus sp. C49 TaxID=2699395 RepID=UPI00137A0018|nr:DNA polymerase Y family protein [Methylosinus sp. C49]
MRCLAVHLPRLSTDRLSRKSAPSPDEAEAPFAVWAKLGGAERLTAVDVRAEAAGLVPGMAVADARAMRPALRLAEADLKADAELLGRIADWCRRFTPLAAADPPNGLLLDISGAAHLFGGEAALLAEVERRLATQGFAARGAIAPGPALARALARFSRRRHVAEGASGEELEAIAAGLPIAALDLDAAARQRLDRAGLRSLGDLLARPRAPLTARLGEEAMARLDAIACRRREPISPRFEAPDFMAERRFPEGLTRQEDIERTLRGLARELCLLLERHGVGARELEAVFYRVDGAVAHIETGTSRPLRDPDTIALLLRERLAVLAEEGLDTGYGYDVLRLGAARVERCDAPQEDLGLGKIDLAGRENARENAHDARLDDLVDRLGARLGPRRVLRAYPQASHIPELAVALRPASGPAPAAVEEAAPPPYLRAGVPARPLRLFERPEPIEAVALTPDGPPLRFRWRRLLHELAAYEGPERIAPQWWSAPENAATRDYFYVEDREGGRFWLFREELLGRESRPPRWFVHGLF